LSLKSEGDFTISQVLGLQVRRLLLLLLSTRRQIGNCETARLSVKFQQKILSTGSALIIQGCDSSLAFVAAALSALHLPCHEGGSLGFGISCSACVRL